MWLVSNELMGVAQALSREVSVPQPASKYRLGTY